jgi:Mg2+-importing ATPase
MFKFLYNFFMPSSIRDEAKTPHARTEDERRLFEICSAGTDQAVQIMESNERGLTEEEAADRLEKYGRNEISHTKRLNFFQDILRRCKSPLVIQLLVIAVVCAIMADLRSAFVVSIMVVLSVGLSYVLDRRSSRAVEALGKRVQSRAIVLRDGKEAELPISDLVQGDIVLLHAGSIIPADLRLLSAKDFFVSEATLTGESIPVEKNSEAFANGGRSVLELSNACFQGTNVSSGSARGLVVNTGAKTFFGAIAERLAERAIETSFDRGVRSFTWLMIRFMVVMVFTVFMIVSLTKGNWLEALIFGLSVAVGLTPEMLPMIVTVNLAKGAIAMSRKKVIVKRLSAIQNFGAIDILCTDKTGTLTQDRVILEKHVDVTGEESDSVLRYAYLNSYYQTGLRNLLDRAVLERGDFEVVECGCRLVDELPFDFQRRRMSVVVEFEGDHVLICKGAVEEIYTCCNHYQLDDEIYPLLDMIRDDLFEEVALLNQQGYRCLAIAYREFSREQTRFTTQDETGLILLGYIAFLDPPKDSAAKAIKQLKETGVQVKILTGDNALVTGKICRDVGLEVRRILNGEELDGMAPEEFSSAVSDSDVLVKLSPLQKERVIESLRNKGHVVGFMGDGVNDAPALRVADVGISVDSAVDVAKESADIVLLEKSLLVLQEGILEGRKVFSNVIKYIRMGASSNFGNMFSVLGASYLLPFLPMQPIQILVNNLLYDFSQIGIPTDHVDEEQIARPRKWDITNIKWFMIFIGPISSIFDYATFAVMWFVFNGRAYLDAAPGPGREAHAQLFQTGWFVESILTQTLIVHIIRTKRLPFIQSRASMPMTLTTLAVMTIGALLPYSPFASDFGLVPLPGSYWGWIASFLLGYSVITHSVKMWFFRRFGGE